MATNKGAAKAAPKEQASKKPAPATKKVAAAAPAKSAKPAGKK